MKLGWLGAELVFQALRDGLACRRTAVACRGSTEGQEFGQQRGGHPVGVQGGELGLQVGQLRSGSSTASGRKVFLGCGWHGQCHQHGLGSCIVPNRVRTTMARVSLCRRGVPLWILELSVTFCSR